LPIWRFYRYLRKNVDVADKDSNDRLLRKVRPGPDDLSPADETLSPVFLFIIC